MRYYCSLHDKEIISADDFISSHPEAQVFKDKGYIVSIYIRDFDNRNVNTILPINYGKAKPKPKPRPKPKPKPTPEVDEMTIKQAIEVLGEDVKCPIDGLVAKSPVGLISHFRFRHPKIYEEYKKRKKK